MSKEELALVARMTGMHVRQVRSVLDAARDVATMTMVERTRDIVRFGPMVARMSEAGHYRVFMRRGVRRLILIEKEMNA